MKHITWLFSLDGRVWSASILNAVLVAHQLLTVLRSHSTEGLSLVMMIGFLYMQVTYTQLGHKTKNWAMFWGMAASAVFNTAIIAYALWPK